MCETLLHSSGAAGTARAVLTGVWGCGSTPGSPGDKGGPGAPAWPCPWTVAPPGPQGRAAEGLRVVQHTPKPREFAELGRQSSSPPARRGRDTERGMRDLHP